MAGQRGRLGREPQGDQGREEMSKGRWTGQEARVGTEGRGGDSGRGRRAGGPGNCEGGGGRAPDVNERRARLGPRGEAGVRSRVEGRRRTGRREAQAPGRDRPAAEGGPTFQAADAPEPRVREAAGVLLLGGARAGRRPVVAGREVGGVADEGARVQPVVGADGDGHEAEGGEGAHRGQQHLHALLAPQAPLLVPALQRLQFDHGQPGGRGPPPGQRGRGRAGGGGGHSAGGSGPGRGRAGARGGGRWVRARPWPPAGGGGQGQRGSGDKGADPPGEPPASPTLEDTPPGPPAPPPAPPRSRPGKDPHPHQRLLPPSDTALCPLPPRPWGRSIPDSPTHSRLSPTSLTSSPTFSTQEKEISGSLLS